MGKKWNLSQPLQQKTSPPPPSKKAKKSTLNIVEEEDTPSDEKENEQESEEEHGPDFCKSCNHDPCIFLPIQDDLYKNDLIYFDESKFAKDQANHNSFCCKKAYRMASQVIHGQLGWGIRKKHFACMEEGICALFPPPTGWKVMGFREE